MSNKAPILRQIAWSSIIPQLAVLGLIIWLVYALSNLPLKDAWLLGAWIYLAYSIGIRAVVAKAHKAGMRRVRTGDFAGAIPLFEESYAYFSQRKWIDRYRFLVLASSSKASYREMALVNIAFCYSQIGNAEQCRAYYEQAAIEFPESALAQAGLNMARTFALSQPTSEV